MDYFDWLTRLTAQTPWLGHSLRILTYFALAWALSFLVKRLARGLLQVWGRLPHRRKPSPERRKTLLILAASAVNLTAIAFAVLASLALFIEPNTLAWVVGLFGTAFGFGARLMVGDYLGGLSFLFEDTFAVGEKIQMPGPPELEGVVERISLRTTMLRSPSGELYIIPNGEIRTVRNFSRGKFSVAKVTLKLQGSDLGTALQALEAFASEAVVLLPNLIEPWQVTSPEGVIGQYTELTLIAKARFGKAAEMRPRLLTLVQERLAELNIQLAN